MELREPHLSGRDALPVADRLRARAVDAIVGSILLDPYSAMAGDPPQQLIDASAAYHARDVEGLRARLPDVTAVARLAVEGLERDGHDPAAVLAELDAVPDTAIDLRALEANDDATDATDAIEATDADGHDDDDEAFLMAPGLRPPPPDARPTSTAGRWARRLRGRHQ